jgi:hypothetical protein
MGFLRKAAARATGMQPVEDTADRIAYEADTRSGGTEFTATFTQHDIGLVNTLSVATEIIVNRLQSAGHTVIGVDTPSGGWAGTVNLHIRPRQPAATAAVTASRGPGLTGLTITSEKLSEAYYWVYATWKEPEPAASRQIWKFRYDLGLEITCWDSLPQNQRFWFDAYAALGARVLKEYGDIFDVGFVRELERRAIACADTENEAQLKALRTLRDQPI